MPWFAAAAVALIAVGLYVGFFIAPTDATQGDAYRIIFVHVPAAWMSMFLYVIMAIWAGLGLGLNARPSFMMAQAIAPTGAMFTFLALFTGSMWGKPTWGPGGVGCPADVGIDSSVSIYRDHLVAIVDRRSAPRRSRQRRLGACRGD